ncbi:MAG: hypothetical protein ACTSRA_00350 [Promethearchaeota archaeon]|nr:MAG: hypothetical protein [Helarchaeota virus Nidhogg Meg22_1012]URC17405.1 MAG: hypothetical protein [Helarchaeota virus Nidhogg Meg22_1214]
MSTVTYWAEWRDADGNLITGLSPSITIYEQGNPSPVVNDSMTRFVTTAIDGVFYYSFTGFDVTKLYYAVCDAGLTLAEWNRYRIPNMIHNHIFTKIKDVEVDTQSIEGKVDTIDTIVDTIKLKTDNLPLDPASETNVDANEVKIDIINTNVGLILPETNKIQSILDDTSAIDSRLPSDPADQSQVEAAISASETNIITEVNENESKIDIIDAIVDAILPETNKIQGVLDDTSAIDARLPSDPADQSQVEAAITASENNIRGADSDTLKTLSDQLDIAQADLDNPDQYKADVSLLALEATSQIIKGHLENGTYGLDALRILIEAIDTSAETKARFDEIKGAGWTDETLKSIRDAIATCGSVWSTAEKDQALQDLIDLKGDLGDASADGSTVYKEAKQDGFPSIRDA